ncbi:hypothetical protein [Scytonema sp. PRP1]|uniref:hypothetical protein n=1 Tax=Scytonema sp. PRP1 TaxID=3120513 RepID=UPI002FD2E26D
MTKERPPLGDGIEWPLSTMLPEAPPRGDCPRLCRERSAERGTGIANRNSFKLTPMEPLLCHIETTRSFPVDL